MKVQLNHPGAQKSCKLGAGYSKIGNAIIRDWNSDSIHHRKFIQNEGEYIDNLKDINPKSSDLYFWGEWEGNSIFTPFPKADNRVLPNGIHKPFHSNKNIGTQNTDPFIFGENFKYCFCKQTGQMCNLKRNDLILFGSTYPSLNKFYIDTVFVVAKSHLSSDILNQDGNGFSQVYKEQTLKQLHEYLKDPHKPNVNKLYESKTWHEDKEFFSFVPCKETSENNGFERFFISLDDSDFQLSSYPSGISYMNKCILKGNELWTKIVNRCIDQGFKLGIKFEEPVLNNSI